MPSDGFPGAVADAEVKVGAIYGERTYEADDLEMSGAGGAILLVGEADVVIGEATRAGYYPAGFDLMFAYILLDGLTQVIARFQSDRMDRNRVSRGSYTGLQGDHRYKT